MDARSEVAVAPADAEHEVLYRVLDEHLDAFLETTRRQADGVPLPAFVEQEFRDFLTCGILAHGFARLRCMECALERLVPFSCKGRGFCPSCGGRRMTEGAARLVDGVLPRVPVRQWVLSLPYRLRYLLAWDHGLARAVLAVSVRVLLGLPAAPRAPLWHPRRAIGLGDGHPALRGRTEISTSISTRCSSTASSSRVRKGRSSSGPCRRRPMTGGVLARIAARVHAYAPPVAPSLATWHTPNHARATLVVHAHLVAVHTSLRSVPVAQMDSSGFLIEIGPETTRREHLT